MSQSKPKFISKYFYVPCASRKELESAGLLTTIGLVEPKVKVVYDRNIPDIRQYAEQLTDCYNELDRDGYDVVNIVPVAIGSSDQCFQSNENYVGDVGYSLTRGAVVVGKLRED
ncbi:hypothetical protein G841_04916 [Escherichia coli HVH 189 (4-3220125)]|uniref:hypothetical protein n=1 Tax=Escherichia coli TaxID=562 RepID=UPI00038F5D96|nr:hypothetical protein [Escherichia coli]EHL2313896.1 hypothetical protein [Salmonella enterica]EQT68641.1 hypothetical protein G841_04916 [Escherichia coli HVH 189 (4-3220125)]HDT1427687.1 hypothetical protein [Escherichia coli]